MAPKVDQRVRLSVSKKYEIIQMLDTGAGRATVARTFGVGRATVADIDRKRKAILDFVQDNSRGASSSTIVLNSKRLHKDFKRILRQWYIRCVVKDIILTGPMMIEKAHELNIRGDNTIKVTLRWIEKFRQRYGLRKVDNDKILQSPNQTAANNFKAKFHSHMRKEGYKLENVYNADTIGLRWQAITEASLPYDSLKFMEKRKRKKVVTTIFCANATGCHKLPVQVIGKISDRKKLRGSYGKTLSIMYKTHNNPYMDNKMFNEWFNECFIKSVAERQLKNGQREKTLLLLTNPGLDQENRVISTKDEFTKIMHFPYDAAPLIQPMDRGIIEYFKRMYRNELLEKLIPPSTSDSEDDLISNYSTLTMDDCCWMVHRAWLNVNDKILKNAWEELLKYESKESSEESEITTQDTDEAPAEVNRLPECGGSDNTAGMSTSETDKEHNTDTQDDINTTLIDFINVAMDTETNELSDENFEDILDDSSS